MIQVLILIGLFTVASMFYKYASAVYKDYQVESEIRRLENRIIALEKDNKELERLIEYLDTDAYKEIIAKSELNLRRPGEIVIAIQDELNIESQELERFRPDSEYQNIPIYEKWFRLFYDH
jgi:cell division protein FtsB